MAHIILHIWNVHWSCSPWCYRWFISFDQERAELGSAYAQDATFSIRCFPLLSSNDSTRSNRGDSRNIGTPSLPSPIPSWLDDATCGLKQGCVEIIDCLFSLPEDLKFCPSGSRKFTFDCAVYESRGVGPEVLIVCYPDVKDDFLNRTQGGPEWNCDQRFILRPRL